MFVWAGEGRGVPGGRAHLLLTTDKLDFHSLSDPPAELPEAASEAWQSWLRSVVLRVQLDVDAEGNIALVMGPPLLLPRTGLPAGFRLDEKEGGEAYALVPEAAETEVSASRPVSSASVRSRRRASVVSSAANLGGRCITPSRKQITAYFQL